MRKKEFEEKQASNRESQNVSQVLSAFQKIPIQLQTQQTLLLNLYGKIITIIINNNNNNSNSIFELLLLSSQESLSSWWMKDHLCWTPEVLVSPIELHRGLPKLAQGKQIEMLLRWKLQEFEWSSISKRRRILLVFEFHSELLLMMTDGLAWLLFWAFVTYTWLTSRDEAKKRCPNSTQLRSPFHLHVYITYHGHVFLAQRCQN